MKAYPIGHVAICVSDLDCAVQFYKQLGLSLSYQTADMAYFYSGTQGIALVRAGSADAKPHFGFACGSREEVEQRHRELSQQGVSVTPLHSIGEAIAFYGQDPSGNWFEYLFEPEPNTATEVGADFGSQVKSKSANRSSSKTNFTAKASRRSRSSRVKGFG